MDTVLQARLSRRTTQKLARALPVPLVVPSLRARAQEATPGAPTADLQQVAIEGLLPIWSETGAAATPSP